MKCWLLKSLTAPKALIKVIITGYTLSPVASQLKIIFPPVMQDFRLLIGALQNGELGLGSSPLA